MRLVCVTGVILVVFLLQEDALARGGRGFGGASSRASRSRGHTYRPNNSKISRYVEAAVSGFAVHGILRYRTRFYGTSFYNHDPTVCYTNITNGNLSDFSESHGAAGYFVCPFKYSDRPDDTHCCGPSGDEYCCSSNSL